VFDQRILVTFQLPEGKRYASLPSMEKTRYRAFVARPILTAQNGIGARRAAAAWPTERLCAMAGVSGRHVASMATCCLPSRPSATIRSLG
jgi:hypothetical protein